MITISFVSSICLLRFFYFLFVRCAYLHTNFIIFWFVVVMLLARHFSSPYLLLFLFLSVTSIYIIIAMAIVSIGYLKSKCVKQCHYVFRIKTKPNQTKNKQQQQQQQQRVRMRLRSICVACIWLSNRSDCSIFFWFLSVVPFRRAFLFCIQFYTLFLWPWPFRSDRN